VSRTLLAWNRPQRPPPSERVDGGSKQSAVKTRSFWPHKAGRSTVTPGCRTVACAHALPPTQTDGDPPSPARLHGRPPICRSVFGTKKTCRAPIGALPSLAASMAGRRGSQKTTHGCSSRPLVAGWGVGLRASYTTRSPLWAVCLWHPIANNISGPGAFGDALLAPPPPRSTNLPSLCDCPAFQAGTMHAVSLGHHRRANIQAAKKTVHSLSAAYRRFSRSSTAGGKCRLPSPLPSPPLRPH
jgi:hypothetical protein